MGKEGEEVLKKKEEKDEGHVRGGDKLVYNKSAGRVVQVFGTVLEEEICVCTNKILQNKHCQSLYCS